MNAIPANWTQLRASATARLDDDLRDLKADARRAARVLEREVPTLTAAFDGAPEPLARVLVVGGVELAASAGDLADVALSRLLSYGDEPARRAPSSALAAISCIAVLRCTGRSLPDGADDAASRWLPSIAAQARTMREENLRTAALASVAAARGDLVPELAGGGPLRPRTTAREIAGPNVTGFARHLAEVIAGGGGADAVEAPWRSFLKMFPLTLGSGGVRWIDLVWAATAVMVHVEHRSQADVGRWLPAHVAELE